MFGKSKPPIDRSLAAERLRAGIEAPDRKGARSSCRPTPGRKHAEDFAENRERRCFAVSARPAPLLTPGEEYAIASDLAWRLDAIGWMLFYKRRRMGRVVPDAKHPGMFRSRRSGGRQRHGQPDLEQERSA